MPVRVCSLWEAELIFVNVSSKRQRARLIGTVTLLIQLRLDRGCRRRQEIRHQAAFVDLMMPLSSLLLKNGHLLVCHACVQLWRLLVVVVQPGAEFRRQGAQIREQELDIPGYPAVIIQEIL